MELLYWLQLHRTAFGAHVFSVATYLGSSLMIMLVLCVLLWLFGRRTALRVAIAFGCTALVNQLIKVVCAVPRPWLRDSRLAPVESAVSGATGYSFPSGHTQTATSLYATLALTFRRRWLSICCAACIICVMLSRLYLGVHTPLDVAAGCAVSLGITCALNRALQRAELSPDYFRYVFICGVLASVGVVLLILVSVMLGTPFDMVGDALPAVGGALGLVSGIYLDSRNEERLPPFGVGIAFCAAGLLVVGGLNLALQAMLTPLLGTHWRGFACYAVSAFYVARVHPAIMRAIMRRRAIPDRRRGAAPCR